MNINNINLLNALLPPKYIIIFDGLFERGYVQFSFFKKSQEKPSTQENSIKNATKFRFILVPLFLCFFLNKNNNLRTYKVLQIL